jgi:DMSO/TMAO reductase YedYZ molybdopterin-dependent catalytic subunit
MDKQPKATAQGRRAFLKTAGLGAAAASAAGAAAIDAAPAAAAAQDQGETYRETAHVKRFYELAKKF